MTTIVRWINKGLCLIGLHGWEYIDRSFFDDQKYWNKHGILPPDEFYCLHCEKRKFTTGKLP